MANVIDVVHKSHIQTHKGCMAQTRFQYIWKIPPPFINESALAGSAFHDTVEDYHRYQYQGLPDERLDDVKYWFEKFVDNFHRRKENTIKAGIQLNTVEDIKAEDYAKMIAGYISKPYNRYAEPVLIETKFYFVIQRGKKKYKFEGTIDQLLRIKKQHIQDLFVDYFKGPFDDFVGGKDYVYIHRDIKTGKKVDPGMLEVDDNINLYAYALAHALFDVDGDGICEQRINLIPYAHCLYFVRDHIPYLKSGSTKSGRKYTVGDDRGSGMYFVKRTIDQLKAIEDELVEAHKFVNSGIYLRIGKLHNRCVNYCPYKDPCFKDLIGEM